MRKFFLWLFLSCKRYGRRPAFFLLLLLLPFGAWFFGTEEQKGENGIRISVFAETKDPDSFDQMLVRKLAEYEGEGEGMFVFYPVDSLEALKEEVAARRAECGYVIYEGLEEKLKSKKLRNVFGLYEAPSTVAGELSTETFFSLMIEEYDRILFLDYIKNENLLPGDRDESGWLEEAEAAYQAVLENGSTFHFVYHQEDRDFFQEEPQKEQERTIFPARGFAAVFIFTTSLYGAVTLAQDEKRGLFLRLPRMERVLCPLASLLAPVLLACFSGFAALWTSGELGGCLREILLLFLYGLASAVFAMILKKVTVKEELLCCLIPFFMVGSLIFCPVFLDVGRYVEGAGWIGKLFLPDYYLAWF